MGLKLGGVGGGGLVGCVGLCSVWDQFGIGLGSVRDRFGIGLGSIWGRVEIGYLAPVCIKQLSCSCTLIATLYIQ
jgi:hypothetical protein